MAPAAKQINTRARSYIIIVCGAPHPHRRTRRTSEWHQRPFLFALKCNDCLLFGWAIGEQVALILFTNLRLRWKSRIFVNENGKSKKTRVIVLVRCHCRRGELYFMWLATDRRPNTDPPSDLLIDIQMWSITGD